MQRRSAELVPRVIAGEEREISTQNRDFQVSFEGV
jgi:hypothetical protein